MPTAPDPEELQPALERFRDFFSELQGAFLEREDVFAQIALALLAREHVLMTGPPGSGKSALASSVINRIPDARTGRPSVFARQVTESTVQTDLVGPIDFKTLMGSGRTEHFTDEGMLGSVHAFLDEVLDGRDMLLRSTLNLLQERELKHGHRVTAGAIECALMTTNRYLSDVLTQSRETLLAFVDRIAFVSFVPRSFARQDSMDRVLAGMVAGRGLQKLRCLLTVQDLDVLQQAVDAVEVPAHVTAALSLFLRDFEVKMQAARRADPGFMPTKYLSVRTAVRLGRLLRANHVYSMALGASEAPLRATCADIAMLRMALLLNGPAYDQLDTLIGRETDPVERKQLEILRREREIFEECLAAVPREPARPPGPPIDIVRLRADVEEARGRGDVASLAQAVLAVATAASRGGAGVAALRALLDRSLDELVRRALILGLSGQFAPEASLERVLQELESLAEQLESIHPDCAPLAAWLRDQVLMLIDRGVEEGAVGLAAGLSPGTVRDSDTAWAWSKVSLTALRGARARRERMLGLGARATDPDRATQGWLGGLQRLAAQFVPVWDEVLRAELDAALAAAPGGGVAGVLAALENTLSRVLRLADALDQLGGGGQVLREGVIGLRIGQVVRLSLQHLPLGDRLAIAAEIDGMLERLAAAGVRDALKPSDLLCWVAETLLRGVPDTPAPTGGAAPGLAGYRRLRADEQRVSGTYVLLDVALRAMRLDDTLRRSPHRIAEEAMAGLAALPSDLRAEIVDHDLQRVARAHAALRDWWQQLAQKPDADLLVDSGFYDVCFREGALRRFSAELGLVVDAFPLAADRAASLQREIEALGVEARGVLADAHGATAEGRWADLYGKTGA